MDGLPTVRDGAVLVLCCRFGTVASSLSGGDPYWIPVNVKRYLTSKTKAKPNGLLQFGSTLSARTRVRSETEACTQCR
jgi:hypothetical protein